MSASSDHAMQRSTRTLHRVLRTPCSSGSFVSSLPDVRTRGNKTSALPRLNSIGLAAPGPHDDLGSQSIVAFSAEQVDIRKLAVTQRISQTIARLVYKSLTDDGWGEPQRGFPFRLIPSPGRIDTEGLGAPVSPTSWLAAMRIVDSKGAYRALTTYKCQSALGFDCSGGGRAPHPGIRIRVFGLRMIEK